LLRPGLKGTGICEVLFELGGVVFVCGYAQRERYATSTQPQSAEARASGLGRETGDEPGTATGKD